MIEVVPPSESAENKQWKIKYGWQNIGFNLADEKITPIELSNGEIRIEIPLDSQTTPGLAGKLVFKISPWNH